MYRNRRFVANPFAPRNEGRYWLLPWKQNESTAAQWGHQVEATLPAGAVVFADTTTYTTLLLQGGPLRVHLGRPKGETLSCLRTTPIYTTLRFGVPRHWAQAEALPTLRLIHITPATCPSRNATHKSPSPSPPPR